MTCDRNEVERTMIERRRLGALEVSALGLGCMSMTPVYGTPDPGEAIAAVQRAPELGIDFIDTSDAYAHGANEELIGRAIAGRRNKYILATKFGNIRLPDGTPGAKGNPAYVLEACDGSLRRLGTDIIDLYFIHRVDDTVPVEDTVGAMKTLVQAGKVRHIGISEAAPATIRRAHATHPLAAVQTEYSLWTRDVEINGVLDVCKELGIGFMAYSPLGRGFLTGAIGTGEALAAKDVRLNMPRFQGENLEHNLGILDGLKRLAAAEGRKPAELAIAWLLSRQPPLVVLAGSSRRKWLEENAAAAGVKLGEPAKEELDRIFAPGVAKGDRYPPGQMRRLCL
jgi:aryl-alcohol dehydrogenase-like predicted oxidoreductase